MRITKQKIQNACASASNESQNRQNRGIEMLSKIHDVDRARIDIAINLELLHNQRTAGPTGSPAINQEYSYSYFAISRERACQHITLMLVFDKIVHAAQLLDGTQQQ